MRSTALRVVAAFGGNDVKNVRREAVMVGVFLGPFMYALGMWLVPPLDSMLERNYDFDLTPYFPLILSAFCVIGPGAVLGGLLGLMILDESDQRTMSALRVAPLPRYAFRLYRGVLFVLLGTFSTTAALALSRLVDWDVVAKAIPIGLLNGLVAMVLGLATGAVASNKVEGFAFMRAVGFLFFGLPVIPWFIDSPLQLFFGVIPSYWPAKAFWLAEAGQTYWPYLLVGFLYTGVLAVLLLRIRPRND